MCDIPKDIAMDGNPGESLGMDAQEAEKVGALQQEPSMGKAVQGSNVAGASLASQSPSQMGNKSRVTRRKGSIKHRTSVLAIASYVELCRSKVNRKELKMGRLMEYGQSRLIDCDHVVKVKGDRFANTSDGRLQLLVWDDKGMGMPLCNSIDVTGCFACSVSCAPCSTPPKIHVFPVV